jgi:hypothetical protein
LAERDGFDVVAVGRNLISQLALILSPPISSCLGSSDPTTWPIPLALVSALACIYRMQAAYDHAIVGGYRCHS